MKMRITLVQNRPVSYKGEDGKDVTTTLEYTIEGFMDNMEDVTTLSNLLMKNFTDISIAITKEG